MNIKNNIYLIKDNDKDYIEIDKKRYFENIESLIGKIKITEDKANKIYTDSKEAQKYFEEQIEIRDNQIKELKQEIDKVKEEYDDINNKINNSKSLKYTSKVREMLRKFNRKKSWF